MKRLAAVLVVLALLTGCHRALNPEYMNGRPLWQRTLFWAGPGH